VRIPVGPPSYPDRQLPPGHLRLVDIDIPRGRCVALCQAAGNDSNDGEVRGDTNWDIDRPAIIERLNPPVGLLW
jgi:hypothetical protein